MTVCPNIVFGRNGRIWTCDHYTPSVVRYQTALRPEWLTILRKIMYIARAIYFSQNLHCILHIIASITNEQLTLTQ